MTTAFAEPQGALTYRTDTDGARFRYIRIQNVATVVPGKNDISVSTDGGWYCPVEFTPDVYGVNHYDGTIVRCECGIPEPMRLVFQDGHLEFGGHTYTLDLSASAGGVATL